MRKNGREMRGIVFSKQKSAVLGAWKCSLTFAVEQILESGLYVTITDVDYIKDYTQRLTFSDGVTKVVDLLPYLTGDVFGELVDKAKIVQYGLTPVTIEWANGADLAPEFLYEIGTAA